MRSEIPPESLALPDWRLSVPVGRAAVRGGMSADSTGGMMANGDAFWRAQEKKAALKQAEESGQVADSLDVRMALVARVKSGEITLSEAQAELAKIKRGAKKAGLVTRAQAFNGG